MKRRTALQLLAGASASLIARRPLWALGQAEADDFFIFIHAAGGWDVTLWADPRNERKGLVEPPSTDNTEIAGLRHWKRATLDGDTETFEILAPGNTSLRLGPAIGNLYDLRERLTIVNGLEMNTVSHPDGVAYSITGRHLAGGQASQASADVVMASARGTSQLVPAVSIEFPSAFVGDTLARRATPLRMTNAATFAKSLARSPAYFTRDDRAAITAVLSQEAREIAARSSFPDSYHQLAGEYDAQTGLTDGELNAAFEAKELQARYPMFDYKSKSHGGATLSAAFAVEAIRRNLVRCVGFSLGGLDTHTDNYKRHATILQDLFGTIATLVAQLDTIPHPTRTTKKLSEKTHILVFSDFCRTPQITVTGGRDHYPNNSALIISPKFRAGRAFGATDVEQLLPARVDGRMLTPPDLLATFLHAFGVDAQRYVRDGKAQRDMLV